MHGDDVKRLALTLPEAVEQAHFGTMDFRVRGKIFVSLPDQKHAVIKLLPEQQEMLQSAEPKIFASVKGTWGKKGWTEVTLAQTDETTLFSALTLAWKNVAPKSLQV
jgi:hypothetical protein